MLYDGISSNVKRGQNLEAEAKTSRTRPRSELWSGGRGQRYEAEARTMRSRPKIIRKKYQIMINNIWFKIIARKINEIPQFYTIFARKMPDYMTR